MNKFLLLSALKGVAVGILASLLLLLIGNGIALQTADPNTTASYLAHAVRLIGGFLTGFAAARFHKEKGLLIGAISGAAYAAILALGAAFMDGKFPFLSACLLCLAAVAAATVGGVLGIPGEKSGAAKRKAMLKRMG